MRTTRVFLAVQAAIFVAAASIHFGLTLSGYQHQAAGTAETIIAVVLVLGLVLTWARFARWAAIAAQIFGVVGVLVGLFTIAIGVGPRTAFDLVLHGLMLVALVTGLVVTARRAAGPPLPA
jgi:hypothetical protein